MYISTLTDDYYFDKSNIKTFNIKDKIKNNIKWIRIIKGVFDKSDDSIFGGILIQTLMQYVKPKVFIQINVLQSRALQILEIFSDRRTCLVSRYCEFAENEDDYYVKILDPFAEYPFAEE